LEKLNAEGQYPIGVTQRLEAAFILSQEAVKQLPGSLFEQGFNDAKAWLPPHWASEWITQYMDGWYSGAAEQMQEYPPYCGIRDNE
jgi:hypothetical protein